MTSDNLHNPVHQKENGRWAFWDECWANEKGDYSTREEAEIALKGGQSISSSAVEILVSYVIGFWVALGGQIFIVHLYGIQTSLTQDFWLVTFFTCLSILRAFLVRRGFNLLHVKGLLK